MAIYKLTRKTFSEELKKMYELKKAGKLLGNVFQKKVGQIAQGATQKGYQKGVQEGIKSVGIKQGMMNTWNNAGKMGKAGMVGAGVAGTALLAKGLFGGNKRQQAAN